METHVVVVSEKTEEEEGGRFGRRDDQQQSPHPRPGTPRRIAISTLWILPLLSRLRPVGGGMGWAAADTTSSFLTDNRLE